MKLKKTLISIICIVIGIIVLSMIYIKVTNTKLVTYNNETKLNSGVTEEYLNNVIYANKVVMLDGDERYVYTYKDLKLKLNDKEELIKEKLKSFILNIDELNITMVASDETITKLEELNNHRVENQYAELKLVDNNFIITPEVIGNKLNIDKLVEALNSELGVGNKHEITLDLKQYTIPFDSNVKREDEYNAELDRYNNFIISYTNGFSIKPENIIKYLDVREGTIVFNEELTKTAVSDMDKLIDVELASYDTVGGDWEFTTHGGETITVSGGTWGDYFNSAKESEYIVEMIKTLQGEVGRQPIKKRDYADSIKNRYIEISLDEQHLWVYDNGEMVMDTPVVTGTKGKHDTPKGVYFISQKTDGTYLRGVDYKTWVNKWMRITDRGHGLHDATWRSTSQFGGKTYMYNGSHGCINLPNKFAYKLYDFIQIHDCVVIY